MPSDRAPVREPVELKNVPFSSPLDTLRKGHRIVSTKMGILRRVSSVITYPGDPLIHAFGILPCDASQFSTQTNSSKSGGAGLTAEAALAATIGEAVERYCMLFYDKRDMVLDSARNLGDLAVAPALLSLYSREQIARNATRTRYFDQESVIRWSWGFSLTRRCWRLVPACQVYLNYRFDADETVIAMNASSGLAAGNTLEEAILSGLHEVIERDAFTISWLHRHAGRRISVDTSDLQALMVKHYHAAHPAVDIAIFDITLDIPVPSTFVIMRRPTESGPAFLVGSAARLDAREAIKKALMEAGQEISYVRYLRDQMGDWRPTNDFSNVTTFDEHFMVYNQCPELIEDAFAFCAGSSSAAATSALSSFASGRPLGDIEWLTATLDRHGYEVIAVDITTPDIRDIGLHVVRVFVPGLVPLHGNHNLPFLGVERLYQVPVKLGWGEERASTDHRLNPFPHPFP